MQTFIDNSGRNWTVSLNTTTLKQVRALCKVDLMEAVEGKLVEQLATDPVLLCDVLYALCKDEAEKKNITDEDFGRGMAGDALEAGTEALLEELVNFFPKGRRTVLQAARKKQKIWDEKALTAAKAFVESEEIDKQVDTAIQAALKEETAAIVQQKTLGG